LGAINSQGLIQDSQNQLSWDILYGGR